MTEENVDVRVLQAAYTRQSIEMERLKSGNGGGTSGGMSDDWKDSVNSQLAQLHGDVRNLLYGLLGAVVLIAGAGWAAYSKLGDQATDARVAQAETAGKLDVMNEKLDRLVSEKPKS